MPVNNTLVNAAPFIASGSDNTLVGFDAGSAYANAESSNILLGSLMPGVFNESNVLRIGNGTGTGSGNLSKAYISGIKNNSLAGSYVVVDSNDQLGISNGPAQCSFLYYLGAMVNNVTGAGTTWTLGTGTALTKVFDKGNNVTTAGVFTAPYTGIYMISANINVTGITVLMTSGVMNLVTTNRTYVSASLNPGVIVSLLGSAACSFNISTLVDMSAGQTATVNVNLAGNLTNVADIIGGAAVNSWISGYLVSQ